MQAFAITLASTSPVAFSLAVFEFGFLDGVIAAVRPYVQNFLIVSITVGIDVPAAIAMFLLVRLLPLTLISQIRYSQKEE